MKRTESKWSNIPSEWDIDAKYDKRQYAFRNPEIVVDKDAKKGPHRLNISLF